MTMPHTARTMMMPVQDQESCQHRERGGGAGNPRQRRPLEPAEV